MSDTHLESSVKMVDALLGIHELTALAVLKVWRYSCSNHSAPHCRTVIASMP